MKVSWFYRKKKQFRRWRDLLRNAGCMRPANKKHKLDHKNAIWSTHCSSFAPSHVHPLKYNMKPHTVSKEVGFPLQNFQVFVPIWSFPGIGVPPNHPFLWDVPPNILAPPIFLHYFMMSCHPKSRPSARPGSCGKLSSTVASSNISKGGGSGATSETARNHGKITAGSREEREFRLVEIRGTNDQQRDW